jgi:uroporphyrinogen-III decarboxylase
MTSRERWLKAVSFQPLDRLPFWPKLDAAYPIAYPAQFSGKSLEDIHAWIGSDNHVFLPSCLKQTRKKTSIDVVKTGDERKTLFKTRKKTLELVEKWDGPSQSWHPVGYPVQSVEDIEVMSEIHRDCTPEPDIQAIETTKDRIKALGGSAVSASSVGTSALMTWVERFAGVENGVFMLFDHEKAVQDLFDAIHGVLVRACHVAAETNPADLIYLIENTSTTLISPQQYEKYCFPHICEYGTILSGAGRRTVLHMCGKLKALLPQLAKAPVQAFEAFTSPTLGDTTLLDGRTACPDTCLIGGTNATLWTKSTGEIIRQIEADLDALPHHRGVVVTSGGVMTPLCKPETIKEVCEWVKSYRPRF